MLWCCCRWPLCVAPGATVYRSPLSSVRTSSWIGVPCVTARVELCWVIHAACNTKCIWRENTVTLQTAPVVNIIYNACETVMPTQSTVVTSLGPCLGGPPLHTWEQKEATCLSETDREVEKKNKTSGHVCKLFAFVPTSYKNKLFIRWVCDWATPNCPFVFQ